MYGKCLGFFQMCFVVKFLYLLFLGKSLSLFLAGIEKENIHEYLRGFFSTVK